MEDKDAICNMLCGALRETDAFRKITNVTYHRGCHGRSSIAVEFDNRGVCPIEVIDATGLTGCEIIWAVLEKLTMPGMLPDRRKGG